MLALLPRNMVIMKYFWLLSLCFLVSVSAEESRAELPLAETCDPEACQLPDCRCSSTNIPGDLAPRDTPQFVLLTFDDAINVNNILTYRRLLDNRNNHNGCPIGITFYVNHEYTNYQLVNELYNKGHEIALHSMSHQTNQVYWSQATYEDMVMEFADQRAQMAHFANIPVDEIKGIRIPFLQMTGNASFQVLANHGLKYDCTWPTVSFVNPGLWPYTLDYASNQDCVIPPCPTASIPGVWVLPMVSWQDLNGTPCSMTDSCYATPALTDEDGWFRFIVGNFERHYLGNRAPFGFYVHEWFVSINPAVERALTRFIDMINNIPDTFMVNSDQVIEWVRNPIPLSDYVSEPCKSKTPTFCNPSSCSGITSDHNGVEYWMQLCATCPMRYPWLGNPLGL